MKLKEMSKDELEVLSYCDIAFMLLKENKKPMNTPALFKAICALLEASESEYTNKIGQFYTSLTTDKRFVLLDTAEWDLRDNHSIKIDIDDRDEDEEDIDYEDDSLDEEIEEENNEEENIEEPIDDEELDIDEDDDLEDLSIVDEEEMEE